MNSIKKILGAIDFSKYTPLVAKHAILLARQLKAEVIFVNILNQHDLNLIQQTMEKLNDSREKFSMNEYIEEMVDERETDMKDLFKQFDLTDVSYKFAIYTGVPFSELLAAIKKHEADLVIMGVKGKSDLKDVLVGSTAIKLFRRCPVPLVSIREPEQ
jgi:nucleotide-binding universal stress UspA family protein